MAFPVGVIGSELDRAYTKHFVRLMKISDNRRTQLMEDAVISAEVVKKPKRYIYNIYSLNSCIFGCMYMYIYE
jgi:hypothetical protein